MAHLWTLSPRILRQSYTMNMLYVGNVDLRANIMMLDSWECIHGTFMNLNPKDIYLACGELRFKCEVIPGF